MRNCTDHGTEKILCPFFRGRSTRTKEICCEGIACSVGMRLIFKRKADMLFHERVYCSDRYHYCELYPAIYARFTEDDP